MALARTMIYGLLFVLAFYVLVPGALLHAEGRSLFDVQRLWPLWLLPLPMVLGFWSAVVLALQGRGTFLPFDPTRRLVVGGPYAIVRNPIQIAGLSAAFLMAGAFESPLMILYSAALVVIVEGVLDPYEQKEMTARFGEAWIEYGRRVRRWLPGKRFKAAADGQDAAGRVLRRVRREP